MSKSSCCHSEVKKNNICSACNQLCEIYKNKENKYCPKCKTEKPYQEFSKSRYTRDGCQVYCKECMKEKTDKYREKGLIGKIKKFYGNRLSNLEIKQINKWKAFYTQIKIIQ